MESTSHSCETLMLLEFSRYIFEKCSSFMKIHPVGAELFHADGWIDVTELIVGFRSFAIVPTNETFVTFMRPDTCNSNFP
jgi:hypothetical protein